MIFRNCTNDTCYSKLLKTINGVYNVEIGGKPASIKVDTVMSELQISDMPRQGFIMKIAVAAFMKALGSKKEYVVPTGSNFSLFHQDVCPPSELGDYDTQYGLT